MERTRRTGSYLLPLFALLWLGMILASDLSAPLYRIDAHIRPLGSDSLVTAVGPSASRAGLRRGDVMLFSELRHLRQLGQRGTAVPVRVRRGTIVRTLMVPLTAVQQPEPVAQRVLADASISFALLLAAYLAFRRPGVMIAALILFLGGGDLSWPAFVGHFSHLPDYIYLPFAAVFSALCEWFPVMALASFAIRLPGDAPSPAQRIATRIVDAMVVIAFLISLWPQAYAMYVFFSALSGMVLMLASLTALRLARPADRGRVGIVFAGVLIGGVGYAANMVGLRLGEPFWLFTIYAEISVVVVPVALAYAILRHRVFDIAFVLNRTIVYAFTSALVVVLLGALEFIAERFLSDETHVESIVLQFGIALLVIISVRLVHRRVDVVVDSVLFRSRHEEESALRRFAATLQFYTEDVPLMRDTVDALLRYARVQGAGVYMAQDLGLRQVQSSFPVAAPSIDHNDTAYVELRAHHEPLHAHGTPTALPGDRLYPMIRAGRVVGVIATGERETGEEMPPDIDEAIKRIADAVATAAGAIESDRIRAELTSLRANFGVS